MAVSPVLSNYRIATAVACQLIFRMSVAERLQTLQYTVDDTPHIAVDGDKCRGCGAHPCLNFCPARCFTPNGRGGIDYYYVGCVECGACLILCKPEAIRWGYPKGGRGISYRF